MNAYKNLLYGLFLLFLIPSAQASELPPNPAELLIDIKTTNTTPNNNEAFIYKVRYRYASTTEHGTNASIQFTFPNAYEIVSPALLGGNISAITNSGNQYTVSLASPSSLGLPTGTLAAGSSGIFEFKVKFKCGVNGSGNIPAAGTTVNLAQNPVFTVSGVSNTATAPLAVTVPTVSACTPPPVSSSSSGLVKQAIRSVIGQGMYMYWNINVPATTSAVTFTDEFPAGFKLYDGLSPSSNFPANWKIEVQANGTWWDITTFNKVNAWIASAANGGQLNDKNGTPIPGVTRVDVDYPYSTPDISYAENVTGLRFTSPSGGASAKNFYVYTYVAPNVPTGWHQNCLKTSNPAWTPFCRDIYVTDRGGLDFGCYFQYGAEALGGSTLSSSNGGYLTTNYPNLYKDPADLQGTLNIEHSVKTGAVEDLTAQVLLPAGFDFVEGTGTPNYWVIEERELAAFNSVAALTPTFTRTPNYNGTGRVLIKWEFPNLIFPQWSPDYINDPVTKLRVYFSTRYIGTVPLPSGNISAYAEIFTGTVMTLTSGGVGYTGTPTQNVGCTMYFGVSGISGSVNSEKYVQGALDVQQSRYPISGNTNLDGDAVYELYIYNHNSTGIKQIDVTDILPYIGDKEMLGSNGRGSAWSEEISSGITVERYKIGFGEIPASSYIPNGILYANTYNACYLDGALPTGQATADPNIASVGQSSGCTDFSSGVAASGAKGFAFRWAQAGDPLLFGEYLKITIPVRQLTGQADNTTNGVAWNSFAYTAVESDDDVLFSSEPLKVGVKMINMNTAANICGRVWKDDNANGKQDSGEPSVEGITVSLYNAAGNPVTESVTINGVTSNIPVTKITDIAGEYCFYGLTPNTNYYVRLENENNFTLSGALAPLALTIPNASGVSDTEDSDATEGTLSGSPIIGRPQISVTTSAAGTTKNNNDFGFYGSGSVGNYVWYDADADGEQDAGELPAQGITMSLYKVGGFFVESKVTDANGRYLFVEQIPANYYIIASTIPAGKIPTTKHATGNNDSDSDFGANLRTDNFTLSSGQAISYVDLGLINIVANPASICGRTWDDFDADGVIDSGEPKMANVTVQLLDASGFVLTATITDANGNYCFNNLTPNTTYKVGFVLPSPTASSFTNAGADMDANTSTGLTGNYTPTTNQNITNVDCGIIGPFSIGNLVWLDVNNNGVRDNGESAYSNVKVYLLNSAGTVYLDSTITDTYGKYLFKNLTQGSYKVAIKLPNDNSKSSSDIGTSSSPNAADNDDNGIGTATSGLVQSAAITLQAGGGSSSGANWLETDHGEAINRVLDPATNPKAYYTVDFGLVFNNCTSGIDSDSDGISDACDLDDDNDGILDTDECPVPVNSGLNGPLTFTFNISTTDASSSSVPHILNSITYGGTTYTDFILPDTYTAAFSLGNPNNVYLMKNGSNVFTYGSNPNYNQDIITEAFRSRNLNAYQSLDGGNNFADGDYYILSYNNPIVSTAGGFIAVTERLGNNPQVLQALDINGNVIGTTINVQLSHYVDLGVNIYPFGTQHSFMALYPIDDLAPVGTQIYGLKVSFGSTATGDGPDAKVFFFGDFALVTCDYDGDGIPNNLDLDSDNDGCPDAIEGGAAFSYANLQNDSLTGEVDGNGVPIVANGGQSVGQSQNTATVTCDEICNDGIDNDDDGLIDCADIDCKPVITNVATVQPSCSNKTGGQITITATGSGTLSYSIKNEAVWQSSNVFTNLGVGQYTIRVKNNSGCEVLYTSNPIIFDTPPCVEICNDGIDNDGDGLIDCDDPDCEDVGGAAPINH